jgi:hypothetical protein
VKEHGFGHAETGKTRPRADEAQGSTQKKRPACAGRFSS